MLGADGRGAPHVLPRDAGVAGGGGGCQEAGGARRGRGGVNMFPMDLIQGDVFTDPSEQLFDLLGAFDAIEHLDDNDNSFAASGNCGLTDISSSPCQPT